MSATSGTPMTQIPRAHCVRRRAVVIAGVAAWAGWRKAAAATFPERAVRIVVPYSVGVGPDVVARSVAEHLARRWGQPVLIDNKPGASGIVAFGDVRRTPPDGHTLFLADTATLAVNPLLHATLPYDPARDLAPLTLLFRATFVLWVGGASRLRSVARAARRRTRAPGSVSYATLGHGHAEPGGDRDAGARRRRAHAARAVQGRGSAARCGGRRRGRLHRDQHQHRRRPDGQRRCGRWPWRPSRAWRRTRRSPPSSRPAAPPVEMHPWAALVTVAGTPPAVLSSCGAISSRRARMPEVRSRAGQAGFEITPSTPQALSERIEADIALYAPLIREGRIARLCIALQRVQRKLSRRLSSQTNSSSSGSSASRAHTMPTSLPFSTTGRWRMPRSCIRTSAWPSIASGPIVSGSGVITSPIVTAAGRGRQR